MPSKNETLIGKLIAIAKDIPFMAKAGRNEAQDYKYVSEAQVTAALRDKFLEAGVLVYPRHRIATELIVNEKGRIVTTIESEWVFTDGENSLTVQVVGQGADNGDKGAFKAMTGSKKYALLQALLIATGEDPEDERATGPTENYATVDQKNELAERGAKVGLEGPALREFVKDATGKTNSSELTQEDMAKLFEAMTVLEATGGKVEA